MSETKTATVEEMFNIPEGSEILQLEWVESGAKVVYNPPEK